jgi:hypothetical protein
MQIKSIETNHVTEQPFKGLVEIEGGFEPYYATVIRYTDLRDGERAERVYSVSGQGETEYQSEQDALDNLKAQQAAKVCGAMEKYSADHGAGNLEIA